MKKLIIQLSLIFVSLSTQLTFAEKKAILIGGGFELKSSQGQIEQNVLWVQQILKKHFADIDIFYGSGGEEIDVTYWDPKIQLGSPHRNQLKLIYGSPFAELLRYKHADVLANMGSTRKSNVLSGLKQRFTEPTFDELLIVYNGHGGHTENYDNNYFKLWDNQRLNVSETNNILNILPKSIPVRFVLTQCFSGGFYDLVKSSPTGNRCGFMSVSEKDESEGCELGINKEDFRDYTTYFFAAMSGRSRLNEKLEFNPDRNNDNTVSYFEAHLYALEVALSSDSPRSTSEIFLEKWEPWYVRWDHGSKNSQSIYYSLAKKIALRHDIELNANLLAQASHLDSRLKEVIGDHKQTEKIFLKTQKTIQQKIAGRFPIISNLDINFGTTAEINEQTIIELSKWLKTLDDYKNLTNLLTEYEQILKQELKLKRQITQVKKTNRLLKLAKLEDFFWRYANKKDKLAYTNLQTCENGSF